MQKQTNLLTFIIPASTPYSCNDLKRFFELTLLKKSYPQLRLK